MIQIDNYQLHSTWEEFSPEEFITVTTSVSLFTEGAFTVDQTKIHLFCTLTGFRINRLKPSQRQRFTDNLLTILEDFNFFYEIVYPDKKFNNISAPVRELLRKTEPEKVEAAEARFAEKLRWQYVPDLAIRRQLIPKLQISRRQALQGYTFDCTGITETSITAEQFIDANQAFEQFEETRDPAYLDLLIAILYCHPYSSGKARQLTDSIQTVPMQVKNAILLNYIGILNYLFYQTEYSILFKTAGKAKKKSKLGMTSILFSMSEKGYGSLKDVAGFNLFTFFDLIYKGIADSIQECQALEMKRDEIAEKLELPVDVINQFL